MRKVEILGRAILDLDGLQAGLAAAGFRVVSCDVSERKGGTTPCTAVNLEDAEKKDPGPFVRAFTDKAPDPAPRRVLVGGPNNTVWALYVDDAGRVNARRV